jgi:hypothetical protein
MVALLKDCLEGLKFILEGVSRTFKPTDDHYPATGMVPYSGEPNHRVW